MTKKITQAPKRHTSSVFILHIVFTANLVILVTRCGNFLAMVCLLFGVAQLLQPAGDEHPGTIGNMLLTYSVGIGFSPASAAQICLYGIDNGATPSGDQPIQRGAGPRFCKSNRFFILCSDRNIPWPFEKAQMSALSDIHKISPTP